MKNIKSNVDSHNKNILNSKEKIERKCNCINKEKCPLNNECQESCIVYQATITSSLRDEKEKIYFGVSETKFKLRFANHKKSFSNRRYEKDTELAIEYWRLKDLNADPNITWKIKKKCSLRMAGSKNCNLCLNEKLLILGFKENNILNKRNELVSKCRHENKHSLVNHKAKR